MWVSGTTFFQLNKVILGKRFTYSLPSDPSTSDQFTGDQEFRSICQVINLMSGIKSLALTLIKQILSATRGQNIYLSSLLINYLVLYM